MIISLSFLPLSETNEILHSFLCNTIIYVFWKHYLAKLDGTLPSPLEVQPLLIKPNLPLPIPAKIF